MQFLHTRPHRSFFLLLKSVVITQQSPTTKLHGPRWHWPDSPDQTVATTDAGFCREGDLSLSNAQANFAHGVRVKFMPSETFEESTLGKDGAKNENAKPSLTKKSALTLMASFVDAHSHVKYGMTHSRSWWRWLLTTCSLLLQLSTTSTTTIQSDICATCQICPNPLPVTVWKRLPDTAYSLIIGIIIFSLGMPLLYWIYRKQIHTEISQIQCSR